MLKLLEIGAENFLSYKNIKLNLTEHHLAQLIGVNGAGKTNLLTIITEVLYGKNTRGYSKAELFNRNYSCANFTIYVKFQDNAGDIYIAKTLRKKATAEVTLSKNGMDITSHTSKGTFSDIEKIIGMDYELFLQYIYQSSKFSTEFLTATPTARKVFLSNMLRLDEIVDDIALVSEYAKKVKQDYDIAIATLNSNKTTLGNLDIVKVEGTLEEWRVKLADVVKRYDDVFTINLTYKQNREGIARQELVVINQRKKLEACVKPAIPKMELISEVKFDSEAYMEVSAKLATYIADRNRNSTLLNKINGDILSTRKAVPADNCDKCGHVLDNAKAKEIKLNLIAELQAKSEALEGILSKLDLLIKEESITKKELEIAKLAYEKALKAEASNKLASEQYQYKLDMYNKNEAEIKLELEAHAKYLESLMAKVIEPVDITPIELEKKSIEKSLNDAVTYEKVSKVADDIVNRIADSEIKTIAMNDELAICKVLIEALKTILARTIEKGIKLLEASTNKYLRMFKSCAFIKFTAVDTKLNVSVIVEDTEVNYYTLSTGQAARVSIATLLAMRDILNKQTGINLLILDEVVGTLDTEGKEQLIDILQTLNDNNILLVSHDWSSPLLHKLEVKRDKENNTVYSEY